MTNKVDISKFEKILFLGLSEIDFGEKEMKRINKICKQKVFLPKNNPQIMRQLRDTDCLLINQGMVADKKMIDAAPKLKYIGILATGYNRIDTSYATSKKITVCNVPGYATEAVAEFVIGVILDHLRELDRAKKQARKGDYSETTFNGQQIKGKTIGIIGFGRIGQRVGYILSEGFGAKVLYWSRKRKKTLESKGFTYSPIADILMRANFITTHLSYARETLEFFDMKKICLIKPGTLFINTAPMELINLKAIEKRLKKNDITFILDHSDEMKPQDINKLRRFKNCIIYPPIGFRTLEANMLKKDIFISNLEHYVSKKALNRVI
jgi:glycerate dehydrogenase